MQKRLEFANFGLSNAANPNNMFLTVVVAALFLLIGIFIGRFLPYQTTISDDQKIEAWEANIKAAETKNQASHEADAHTDHNIPSKLIDLSDIEAIFIQEKESLQDKFAECYDFLYPITADESLSHMKRRMAKTLLSSYAEMLESTTQLLNMPLEKIRKL